MSTKIKSFFNWVSQINETSSALTIINDDLKRDQLSFFEERSEGHEEVIKEIATRSKEERTIIVINLCRLYPLTKKLVKCLLQNLDKNHTEQPVDHYLATGDVLLKFLSSEVKELRKDIKGQTSRTIFKLSEDIASLETEEQGLLSTKVELESLIVKNEALIKERNKLQQEIKKIERDLDTSKIEDEIKKLEKELADLQKKQRNLKQTYSDLKEELLSLTETSKKEKELIKNLIGLWPKDKV